MVMDVPNLAGSSNSIDSSNSPLGLKLKLCFMTLSHFPLRVIFYPEKGNIPCSPLLPPFLPLWHEFLSLFWLWFSVKSQRGKRAMGPQWQERITVHSSYSFQYSYSSILHISTHSHFIYNDDQITCFITLITSHNGHPHILTNPFPPLFPR